MDTSPASWEQEKVERLAILAAEDVARGTGADAAGIAQAGLSVRQTLHGLRGTLFTYQAGTAAPAEQVWWHYRFKVSRRLADQWCRRSLYLTDEELPEEDMPWNQADCALAGGEVFPSADDVVALGRS